MLLRKGDTKSRLLEEMKDYIISQYIGMDGPPRTFKSLAEEMGVSLAFLAQRFARWRREGDTPDYLLRNIWREQDRLAVLVLFRRGMTVRELSQRWQVARRDLTVELKKMRKLPDKRTRLEQYAGPPTQDLTLGELEDRWSEVTDPALVSVGGVPRFYLVPLELKDTTED